ncbi:MAG: hypothetical protein GXO78_01725 [Calditrichaeota bacterium]|nr:hypothetical protein [Calditrichota bacterium]
MMKGILYGWMILFLWVTLHARSADTMRVQYQTPNLVYVNQGRAQGLALGDTLRVIRNGQTIARLVVQYVSSRSAACRVVQADAAIRVGDQVERVEPATAIAESPTEESPRMTDTSFVRPTPPERVHPESAVREQKAAIRGHLAIQFFGVDDFSSNNRDYGVPNLSLRLRAQNLWRRGMHIHIRLRSRYYQRNQLIPGVVPQQEWRNRLYEMAFIYEPSGARLHYRFGRLLTEVINGVGYLDGLLLQGNLGSHLAIGGFSGTQPDWRTSAFQTDVTKHGLYLRYRREAGAVRYSGTAAITGEYRGGKVSREFLYIQNRINLLTHLYIYQSAEVEWNRGWRRQRSGTTLALTSFYAMIRYQPFPWISTTLSVDNRQNYWTYEIVSLADSLFNRNQRQGIRGYLQLRLPSYWNVQLNVGVNRRVTDTQPTYNFGGVLSKRHLFLRRSFLSLRFFGFTSDLTSGQYVNLMFRQYLGVQHYVALAAGGYTYTFGGDWRRNQMIFRLTGHLAVGVKFYLRGYLERQEGSDFRGIRGLMEVGYQF